MKTTNKGEEMKEEIVDWVSELLRKKQPLHLRIKYWLKLNDLFTKQ